MKKMYRRWDGETVFYDFKDAKHWNSSVLDWCEDEDLKAKYKACETMDELADILNHINDEDGWVVEECIEKGERKVVLKVYLQASNADMQVIFTNGVTAKAFWANSNGRLDGVDLYQTDSDGRRDINPIILELSRKYNIMNANGELEAYSDMCANEEIPYQRFKDMFDMDGIEMYEVCELDTYDFDRSVDTDTYAVDIIEKDSHTWNEAWRLYDDGDTEVYSKDDLTQNFNYYVKEFGYDEAQFKEMLETEKPLDGWGVVAFRGCVYFIRYNVVQ